MAVNKPVAQKSSRGANKPVALERCLAIRQYWVEFKSYPDDGFWACLYADRGVVILLDTSHLRHGRTANVTRDSYNQTWRLWKVKPTNEQRKAAPWN